VFLGKTAVWIAGGGFVIMLHSGGRVLVAGVLLLVVSLLGGCSAKPTAMKNQPTNTSTSSGTVKLPGGKTSMAN